MKKIIVLSIIFLIVLLLTLSGRSTCINGGRKKNTRVGSSNNTFTINAPSNLSATAFSTSQIDLSWQDNSNNEDGFEVERKMWTNGPYVEIARLAANVVSYSDSELSVGATYYYRVRAFNTIGDYSQFCAEAGANTVNNIVLSGISAGGFCNVARSTSGIVFVWGFNDYFQLGLGDTVIRNVPTPLGTETDWSLMSTGFSHTIALKNDQTLWGWGSNNLGQAGFGDTYYDADIPYQIGTDADFSFVAAGGGNPSYTNAGHSIAIKTNRTLWIWGNNGEGQLGIPGSSLRATPSQVGTDSDWVSNTAGYGHTLAIKTNYTLWAWGRNSDGQLGLGGGQRNTPTQVGTLSDWSMVVAGNVHTLAIKNTGTLWGCGKNWWGQLGLGDTNNRNTPTQIGNDSDWSKLAANGDNINEGYSLGMKNNGTIWSWGGNTYGKLGLGDGVNRKTPAQIGIDSDWSFISAGRFHAIAAKTNGTLWSWGGNAYAQLGFGDNINRNTPTFILFGIPSPPSSLSAIIASLTRIDLSWEDFSYNEEGFKLERKTNRSGIYEQIITLNFDITSYSDITPSGFAPDTTYYYRVRAYNTIGNGVYSNESWCALSDDWSYVSSNDTHTVGLKINSTLWLWGNNEYGQLGLDDVINRNTPTQVGSDSDWSKVIAGYGITIAHKNDKTLWVWGSNDCGQLGLGPDEMGVPKYSPAQLGTDSDWIMSAIGGNDVNRLHVIALRTNLTLWAWGGNDSGQLGLGDGEVGVNKEEPIQVGTDSDWSKISAASIFSMAIKTSKTLWTWGDNEYGKLGLEYEGGIVSSPAQVGGDSDWDEIVCAGMDSQSHTIAMKTNGTIWSWGYDDIGQLGLGTTGSQNMPMQIGLDTDWLKIATGAVHSIVLKKDNTAWVWGFSTNGQLGLGNSGAGTQLAEPAELSKDTDWMTIAAGSFQTFAIKTNSTLWAWGSNYTGQLGLGDTVMNRITPTLVGK